jgi:hypothetical protein
MNRVLRFPLNSLSKSSVRSLFITTETTPNPNALKFFPGKTVLGEYKTYDFPDINAAYVSPLAKRIFSVSGVQGCFFGPDFITVIRYDDEEDPWKVLKPELYAGN